MPAPPLDEPRAVREPLDRAALAGWLQDTLGLTGELEARQFPSGYSNLTYLVQVGDCEVVLRRPPPGADIKGGHDMGREVRVLRALHGHVPVPEPLGFEESGDVLGVPFYAMERVGGVILRSTVPEAQRPGAAEMAGVAAAFVRTFAALHAVDLDAVGLADFGKPEGYVRRQIDGWHRRYLRAKTDELPELTYAFAWLDERPPPEVDAAGAALIHNDFKYDNLVLDPADLGRVRAVLDWELATVGAPLMDLGSALGYWVEAGDHPALQALALSPTWWPGNPTRDELVQRYAAASGRRVDDAVAYYVYGLVKLAVIAQQIYARWKAGHAKDPRFEGLIHTVRACGETAARAIERQRLSDLF
jgi:aminoglycoside phosphotransferase (APT) family kinase protein